MSTKAVEVYRRQSPTEVTPAQWDTFRQIAATVSRSRLGLEAWYNGPSPVDNIMVGLLFAQAVDVPPLMVLQNAYPVNGRVTVMTEFLLGLCRDRIPGFDHTVVESTKESCTVRVIRDGMKEPLEYTHTTQMAKDSDYYKKTWLKQEQMMNYYAATRRAIRMIGGAGSMWLSAVPRDPQLGEEHEPLEASGAEVVEDENAAEKALEAAGAAVEGDAAGASPEAAAPSAEGEDPRRSFMDRARELGANTRAYKTMQGLVSRLLSDHGAVIAPRKSDEVGPHEWRMALQRMNMVAEGMAPGGAYWADLSEFGVGGAPKDSARGTDAHPPAEGSEAAAEGGDGPQSPDPSTGAPAAVPGPAVSAPAKVPEPPAEDAYESETNGTPDGLIAACKRAERAYKAVGQGDVQFAQEWPAESGEWWFVFAPVLEKNGNISNTGSAQPKKIADMDERALFSYATGVRAAIQELEAKGVLRGGVR